MRLQSLAFVVLFVGLALSGCISPEDDEDDDAVREPVFTDIEHNETTSLIIPVTTGVHPQVTDLPGEAQVTLPGRSKDLAFTPSWTQALNAFAFVIERPDGETDTVDLGDSPRPIEYATPAPGTFTIHLRAQGVVQEDTVTIVTTYTWIERVYEGAVPSGESVGGISVVRDGDQWKATLISQASGPAVGFELVTSFGDIEVVPSDGDASSKVTVIAWADSEEAARDAVHAAIITNTVQSTVLVSRVGWPQGCCDDEIRRDARIDAAVPQDSEGAVSTSSGNIRIADLALPELSATVSSGDIRLDGLTLGTLSAATSSGTISGDIKAAGDIDLSTSSGDVTLTVEPTESLRLSSVSSSGSVTLTLSEGSDIAYALDLSTSSGEFSESMDDASLEYPDPDNDDRAKLVTSNGAGRAIQVTGSVTTSSGDQEFVGA